MGKNVNEEVNEIMETEEALAETTTEVEEKKGFLQKVGNGIGKAVGKTVKVVTSTPGKIVAGTLVVAGAVALGYKAGKDGFPHSEDNDDSYDDDVIDVESSEESND